MSEVKVNKISPRSGTDVQLGDSGDTFTIPSGATINNQGTATNFGATGAASWDTTVKTGDFTAVAGTGYFVNTTSGAINVTLPAGTAGAVVAIKDYAGTFDTNAVTLIRNGSDKIGGLATNGTLSTEGIAVTLVFIDSTQGWLVTDSGLQSEAPTPSYVTATGGTPTTDGDFKIHTFTGPGTFCVSSAGNSQGSTEIEYLVVAGAGGAGYDSGGGGGAGGFRFASPSLASATYPGKPLAAPAAITASVASFPIVVGGGGTSQASGGTGAGASGSVSTFSTITSAGGGGGGSGGGAPGIRTGLNGGSGGGGGNPNGSGGNGNTPSVSPAQGRDGGDNQVDSVSSAGGGGAINAATDTSCSPTCVGSPGGDGAGIPTAFGSNGVSCGGFRYYAGGGGGGSRSPSHGPGGSGGKGGGGAGVQTGAGGAGTVNTGGGAGGPSTAGLAQAGAGGSGIVVIRYKFQN